MKKLALTVVLLFGAASAFADVTAADAFAKLKAMAGKWDAHLFKADGPAGSIEYKVTAGGSAVMETFFPGSDHEMVTLFTVDGNELVATHYCASGNQPSLKLNRATSTPDHLVFDFVALRGADAAHAAHMHNGTIAIKGDKAEEEWAGFAEGKPSEEPHRFFLSRGK